MLDGHGTSRQNVFAPDAERVCGYRFKSITTRSPSPRAHESVRSGGTRASASGASRPPLPFCDDCNEFRRNDLATKIRLTRVGSKKNPIYRVVVADARSPRDGRFIEIVGRYNPQPNPSLIELDAEKVKSWLDKGAQPTEAVARLIKVSKIV